MTPRARTAFVFAGQASDIVGLPATWSRRSTHVRALLEEAARAMGALASRMTSPAGLARTSCFQPVLTALSVGIARELADRGLRPDVVAGHSLGEIAACAAGGASRDEDAVALAVVRGALMERAAARRPGGMIALPLGDRARAEAAVNRARTKGVASLAAHNSEQRWVVSGDWDALREIEAHATTTRLSVAGPWHSPLMDDAVADYHAALRSAITMPLRVPLVCNRYGSLVTDAATLPDLLAVQLTHCIRWADVMTSLSGFGVRRVVLCGPGKALRAFLREGLPGAEIWTVEAPDDLALVAEARAG